MNIRIWSDFSKRQNSTKIPDTYGEEVSVYLKENTSIRNPSFILSDPMPDVTYVHAFGNYYFVTDVVNLDASRAEIICTMDILATYRNDILGYTAFVERSASAFDVMVPDNLLSSQQDLISKTSATTAAGFDRAGLYVVPVSSKYGVRMHCFNSLGAASAFYNCTQYKDASGNTLTTQGIDDLIVSMGFRIFNLDDYMGAMMWLPVNFGAYSEGVASVAIGSWDLNIAGYPILAAYEQNITTAIAIPDNVYSDFRKADPRYSKYSLWLPGVGLVGINSADAAEGDLYVDIMTDFLTGAVTYRVYHAEGADIAAFNGQVGVAVPSGKSNINVGGFITNAIGTIASVAAASSGVGAAAAAIGGAVATASTILDPQTCISGGAGNKCIIQERPDIICTVENYGSKEFPTTEAGRPYFQHATLGNLSGFVQCGNASVPVNARDDERAQINSYLNSGFYVE